MKKITALVFMIWLPILLAAQTPSDTAAKKNVLPYIKKYYVGLIAEENLRSYYQVATELKIRAGIMIDAPLGNIISVRSRIFYEPIQKVSGIDFRLYRNFGDLTIGLGYIPTLAREFFTPNPITPESHFLPESQKVICAGARPGIALSFKNLCLGAYSDNVEKPDSFEFHIGFKQENIGRFLKSVKLAAYVINDYGEKNELLGGAGLSLVFSRFDFIFFSAQHYDYRLYSATANFYITPTWNLYGGWIYKDGTAAKTCDYFECGTFKSSRQKIGPVMVKYVWGVTYQRFPQEYAILHLQVYLNEQ